MTPVEYKIDDTNYKSPITMVFIDSLVKDLAEKTDEYLANEVRKVGFDIDKYELAKALKYDRDQYEKGFHDGRMCNPTVITNGDAIRAKSDEELAVFLYGLVNEFGSMNHDCLDFNYCKVHSGEFRYDGWLDWLKQEAET